MKNYLSDIDEEDEEEEDEDKHIQTKESEEGGIDSHIFERISRISVTPAQTGRSEETLQVNPF